MNSSKTSPILVTGATGYVASHIIKQLLEQGHYVRGTVRSLKNKEKYQFLYDLVPEKKDNLEFAEADLLPASPASSTSLCTKTQTSTSTFHDGGTARVRWNQK